MKKGLKIYFSRHAKRQMKWRGISEDEVMQTVLNADGIEDSVKARTNAFKLVGKKLVKVTFKQESDRMIVITAMVRK